MTNLLLGVLTECDAWETGWENPEQRQLLTGLASSVRDICWKGDNLKLPRYTSSDFLCWSSFKRTKPHHSWTGARAAWAAGAASALFPAEAALPPCRGGESLYSREILWTTWSWPRCQGEAAWPPSTRTAPFGDQMLDLPPAGPEGVSHDVLYIKSLRLIWSLYVLLLTEGSISLFNRLSATFGNWYLFNFFFQWNPLKTIYKHL